MKKYSLLVFDWDGTLVDSEELAVETILDLAKEFNYQVPTRDTVQQCFGMSLENIYQKLFHGHNEYPIFDEKFYANFTEEKLATNFFDGAIETLQYLKDSGFILAVATNRPRPKLEKALELSNTKDLFSGTECSEDTKSKPHPDMLLTLLKELACKPQDALMIGDSVFDMEFASNAKVDALATCYTDAKREQLEKYHPVKIIEDIKELKDIF